MEDFAVVDKNGEITDKNAFMTPLLRSVEYSPRKELALHLEEVFVWLACINRDMSKSSRSKEPRLMKKEIARHLVNNFQQLFLNNEIFRKQVIESLRLSQPKT